MSDLDFWEFVSCAKCHLPYASNHGRSVPFWLTECGHVICNNHLSPDQSCTLCGSTGIQLVPLQQELDAPMSDWFKSIPLALDSIAYAAKFQQETMARQITFYRTRHQQIRALVEKLRSEVSELRRANEMLSQENEQLRQQCETEYQTLYQEKPLDSVNQNGKRPLETPYQYEYPSRRPRTDSSPLPVATSSMAGPSRLTLLNKQYTPESKHPSLRPTVQQRPRNYNEIDSRPLSKRIEKYAYLPSDTNLKNQALQYQRSEAQPINLAKPNQYTTNVEYKQPSTPSRQEHHSAPRQDSRIGDMGPPPIPLVRNTGLTRLSTPVVPSNPSRQFVPQNRRFIPGQDSTSGKFQPTTSHGNQRVIPGPVTDNSTRSSITWQSKSSAGTNSTSARGSKSNASTSGQQTSYG